MAEIQWDVGDTCMAKIFQTCHARVKVSKEDSSQLFSCQKEFHVKDKEGEDIVVKKNAIHVTMCHDEQQLWVPEENLYLKIAKNKDLFYMDSILLGDKCKVNEKVGIIENDENDQYLGIKVLGWNVNKDGSTSVIKNVCYHVAFENNKEWCVYDKITVIKDAVKKSSKRPMQEWENGAICMARIDQCLEEVKICRDMDDKYFADQFLGFGTDTNADVGFCYHVQRADGSYVWIESEKLCQKSRKRPSYKNLYGNVKKPLNVVNSPGVNPPLVVKKEQKSKPRDETANNHLNISNSATVHKYNNFLRVNKEKVYEELYQIYMKSTEFRMNKLKYLNLQQTTTEDIFNTITEECYTEKEVELYISKCWKFKEVYESYDNEIFDSRPKIHTSWCMVCGVKDDIIQCQTCPSCYHPKCFNKWRETVIYRQIIKEPNTQNVVYQKRLSSTRTVTTCEPSTSKVEPDSSIQCPNCVWGPGFSYGDIIWHKLPGCGWWPAKIALPGTEPAVLKKKSHTPFQWAVQYYGTKNYSWADAGRMTLFLTTQALDIDKKPEDLREAIMEACDDYIATYLK